ncbi:MAG: hypothetical protein NC251_10065 [Lachnoclostridium sp.]|nr:hypothetical protein [Lachnospira sp.]MCM1248761.1 hypothetical protein [Lachnoclostridium sp.]MCM1535687.1 hypothetical protein [Clostridium sp.]
MAEACKSAWMGWQQYIDNGKLAALLLAVLLFLVLGNYLKSGLEKQLVFYTVCLAVLCICPFTAAVLMRYQTGFYEYQWIWAAVPVTLMIAFGGTVFLFAIWENYRTEYKRWARNSLRLKAAMGSAFLTGFCILLLFLSGSLGEEQWLQGRKGMEKDSVQTKEQFQAQQMQVDAILETVMDSPVSAQDSPYIFAPSEVMESARMYSGGIRLVYGRNMWDSALNVYTYEDYDAPVRSMYQWMCEMEDRADKPWREAEPLDEAWEKKSRECLQNALDAGVNIVILPEGIPEEALEKVEQMLGAVAQEAEGYYLFSV